MTEIFDLADRIVEESADADPIMATYVGVPGRDHLLTDYSVAASDARAVQARGWLAELDTLPVTGEPDRVAAAVIRERLGARLAMHEVGEHLRDINVLGSPVQNLRDILTLMPSGTDEEWGAIASRLEGIPAALAHVRSSFEDGMARGVLPARRQVLGTARTAAVCAGLEAESDGEPPSSPWFEDFVAGYDGGDPALVSRLAEGAAGATAAYADCAVWLREVYAPAAVERDAVGRDRYVTLARVHCGADIDPEETYAWGWEELGRITRRMNDCASRLYGGVTPVEAQERLDVDPEHTIEGAEQARAWLQRVTDETMASFDGTYFDIPEQMRRCDAVLAPPGGGAAPYYTSPSEDFSRPGRTWLPVFGQSVFRTWWLLSVWYHEAVPGHHLQVAYSMLQRERLSRFQRVEFVSGHGEGWALYAERLMDELGYFDNPAVELGYLSAQALRAARVVVDIGLHLELAIPDELDPALLEGLATDIRGRVWDRELACDFLMVRALEPESFAASEVDRYLGIPGQAISYKVGERVWLQAREDARAAAGEAFDLKAWHMKALALGSVGLDVLRDELARA
jgi:uncharacterized protein (DUF885 family)